MIIIKQKTKSNLTNNKFTDKIKRLRANYPKNVKGFSEKPYRKYIFPDRLRKRYKSERNKKNGNIR